MKRFEHRTVIVTGGARGMGASHARGPDSNAMRGTIDVTLRVDSTPLERPTV